MPLICCLIGQIFLHSIMVDDKRKHACICGLEEQWRHDKSYCGQHLYEDMQRWSCSIFEGISNAAEKRYRTNFFQSKKVVQKIKNYESIRVDCDSRVAP
jgi:hypothetical protein